MTSLFEAFPLLERMYSPYETRFHPHDAETSPFGLTTHDFAENMWLPGVVAIAYYLGIAGSIKIMEHRKAFDLKFELAAWNFFLCVFSAVGAARTMPHLVYNVANYPMQRSLCGAAASDWGAGACGFWVQLFILSKFAELLDTAFIIARKKKLMFLHWYHHFSVMLYCWHSYATEAPHALFFVAMNYCVHSVMYFYYGLMAANCKPKWFPTPVITAMQISQMIVGVAVQVGAIVMQLRLGADACPVNRSNIAAGTIMYASYFALFVKFALKRFVYTPATKPGDALTTHAGFGADDAVRRLGNPKTFPITAAIIHIRKGSPRSLARKVVHSSAGNIAAAAR